MDNELKDKIYNAAIDVHKAKIQCYKNGFNDCVQQVCNWLDENLEYFLGDYNLASHDFEANQPLYGRLINELRIEMSELIKQAKFK